MLSLPRSVFGGSSNLYKSALGSAETVPTRLPALHLTRHEGMMWLLPTKKMRPAQRDDDNETTAAAFPRLNVYAAKFESPSPGSLGTDNRLPRCRADLTSNTFSEGPHPCRITGAFFFEIMAASAAGERAAEFSRGEKHFHSHSGGRSFVVQYPLGHPSVVAACFSLSLSLSLSLVISCYLFKCLSLCLPLLSLFMSPLSRYLFLSLPLFLSICISLVSSLSSWFF